MKEFEKMLSSKCLASFTMCLELVSKKVNIKMTLSVIFP